MAEADDREGMISHFTDITGVTEERAKFYLESANWTLPLALSSFYEVIDVGESEEMPVNVNDNSDAMSSSEMNPIIEERKTGNNNSKLTKPKPRIATLRDMVQPTSDDEEGQAFYAGGSERSGQQVLGPPKRKNFNNELAEMFKMAQESGALLDIPNQASTSNTGDRNYSGVGIRLGQTENDQVTVSGQGTNQAQSVKPVILKLWNQGFSVNDGELRQYDEPNNKEFLESVMCGQIPNELRKMGSMVSVDVEDHRHEDFKKPKTKTTFKGSGHTLGSPAPKTEPVVSSDLAKSSNDDNEKKACETINIDANQPVTVLQIRLSDGSRLSARMNLSHTINDIRRYITIARPQYERHNFSLVTSFPTKELNDDDQTIENAGLANSSIMQRLK